MYDLNLSDKLMAQHKHLNMMMKLTSDSTEQVQWWTRSERILWLSTLCVGNMCLYFCRAVMPLTMVAVASEFELDKMQSGAVLSTFFWGYAMTQIFGGYMSDRIGGDIVLMTAGCGWSFLTFSTPIFPSVVSLSASKLIILIMCRVMIGCFQGVHFPSLSSILTFRVPETNRAFTFAVIGSGSHFGTLLCGSVGSYLLKHQGWRSVFYCAGVITFLWLIFFRYYLILYQRKKSTILGVMNMTVTTAKEKPKVPWVKLLSSGPMWGLLVCHFSHCFAFFILLSWLPTYFKETYPSAKGWVFNVVPWVVGIPTTICSGWLADALIRTGQTTTFVRKLFVTIELSGMMVCLLLLNVIHFYEGSLFCLTMAIAFSGLHAGSTLVNPQDVAPKYAGSVFGIMNTAGSIPGFLGVYLVGYILESWKSWTYVFNLSALVCLLGNLMFLLYGSGSKITD